MPEALYPGANRTERYWPSGGGVMQTALTKLVMHSTETTSLPGYSNGGSAPTLTVDPWKKKVWQHFRDVRVSAKALRDTGGFAENRDQVAQIEVIGYSDRATGQSRGRYLPDLPQDGIDFLAGVMAWFCVGGGGGYRVPVRIPTQAWPTSSAWYGPSRYRMTTAQYDAYTGILAHAHVPDSVHWDAALPIDKLLAAIKRILSGSTTTTTTPAPGAAPKFPLAKGYYFGPKEGPKESVSGYYHTQKDGTKGHDGLEAAQRQLKTLRYLNGTPDGLYGPDSEQATKKAQTAANLRGAKLAVDGRIGEATWPWLWTLASPPATTTTTTTPKPTTTTTTTAKPAPAPMDHLFRAASFNALLGGPVSNHIAFLTGTVKASLLFGQEMSPDDRKDIADAYKYLYWANRRHVLFWHPTKFEHKGPFEESIELDFGTKDNQWHGLIGRVLASKQNGVTFAAASVHVRASAAIPGTKAQKLAGKKADIREVISKLAKYPRVVVGGDFNTRTAIDLMQTAGYLLATPDKPTTDSGSTLDFIFVRGVRLRSGGKVLPTSGSDHHAVLANGTLPGPPSDL